MPKILIVDDEWLTRLEIEEMLTDLGYDVAGQAETGAEAIAMARELNPDLILMDVKMPGEMNGIDAARKIKAELGTPIVFISGYGDPEYIEAAKEIAPFGYVMKPFDEREVHAFVEIALSRRKLELKLEESHDELERRVESRTAELRKANKQLQEENEARKRSEEALRESEEHLRSFMESAKGFIVYRLEVDPENYFSGRLIFVSPGIEDEIGVSPEAEFSEWFNNVHPDDLPGLIEAQAKSVQNGDTFDREFRWKNIIGGWGWCHAISNPVFDSNGKPKYYNGIVMIVTAQHRAEEALQESQQRMALAMEGGNIGMFDWDLRTGEAFFDRRWHESLGYSPGDVELNSRTWEKIIHSEDWSGAQQTLKDNLRGRIPFYENEVRLKCKSGQWKWVLTRAKIVERDSNGKALRIIGTSLDINDRKLMEIELQNRTFELSETNTALKVLLNQREKDKEELGEKVLSNVKSLVEPYLKELKNSRVDQRQIVSLDLLESGLKNILSSFSGKLSSKYLGLTPGELQVAYLIKEGKRTKEIAELLNLSGKTIEDYRKNLRQKLGIRNVKVNLRTHLLSIQK
jgi:PAS domain S-box-containing protein